MRADVSIALADRSKTRECVRLRLCHGDGRELVELTVHELTPAAAEALAHELLFLVARLRARAPR